MKRAKGCIVNPIAPSRVIAGACGMAAFAVAVISGLWVDNPVASILSRALLSLALCYALGMLVGTICEHAVREHMVRYKAERPVPEADSALKSVTQPSGAEDAA
ncbi:MAG: hypothetical protein ACF8NJ_02510 [Phycisphaerales bacterium JB038]